MKIKQDKWYKRLFTKLMWKLRIWQPPEYGHGVYKEQGIQIKNFDVDAVVDNINKHDGSYESIQRISDAMRGSYSLTPEYLPPKESGLKYSEETTKAIEMAHDLELKGVTCEWVDNLIEYAKDKKILKKESVLQIPYGIRCPDSVKMYALEKGIKIVNYGDL
jgi:hypothetical protein